MSNVKALPLHEQLMEKYTVNELLGFRTLATWGTFAGGFFAFLMVSYFVVKWWLAGTESLGADQWFRIVTAVGIVAVITIAQGLYYVTGVVNNWLTLMKWGLVFFGMFIEGSQVMQNEGDKVKAESQNSELYKTALANAQNPTAGVQASPYASQIAAASAKLEAHKYELSICKRHARKGKKRVARCVNYEKEKIAEHQGKINSFKALEKQRVENGVTASKASLDQAKEFGYDEENHFEMIKFLKSITGLAAIAASFLMSMILIGAFEGAYYFVARLLGEVNQALKKLGIDTSLLSSGFFSSLFGGVKKKQADDVSNTPPSDVPAQGNNTSDHVPAQEKGGNQVNHNTQTANSGTGNADGKNKVDDKAIMEAVYREYLKANDLKTTARAEKPWFSQAFKAQGVRKHIDQITKLRSEFAERAFNDGVFSQNPDWDGVRNVPKYVRG